MNRRRWFLRRHRDENMNEELRFHIERQTAANIAAGMTPHEARRQSMLQFGGVEAVKENCREQRRGFWLESLWVDLRFGFRMLCKNPGFSVIAVLTLSLAIGASTAVFSVVNAVLLKPPPYPHSERIVFPWRTVPPGFNLGYDQIPWGRFEFLFFSHELNTFQAMGAFLADSFNLTGSGEPARIDGLRASAGFFPSLGVSPSLGRTFTPEEDQLGHNQEVVLSHKLWRERFAADPDVLGRVLELNGEPYTVIGVMPEGFAFPRAAEMPGGFTFAKEVELWVPLALVPGPVLPAESSELAVVGRMRPGVTREQSQAEMDLLGKRLERQFPNSSGWFNARLTPMSRQVAGDTGRPLLLLLGAVGVVLLIACSNVASLFLARSLKRRREFTLRAALGAAQGRLVRQLLTESVLLASVGGLVGLLFANAGIYFVKVFGPANIPRLHEVSLDLRVLAFTLTVTLLTGVFFGLAPAIGAVRASLMEALKEGGQRSGEGPSGSKIRSAFLVTQVALALVLVVATGLLTQTLFRLLKVDPGFRAEHVLTFELSLPASKYPDVDRIVALYHGALQRLRALPGVESAGIVEIVPMSGATESTALRIPGRPAAADEKPPYSNYTIASPGYFAAVGTPLLRGRDFLETDTSTSEPVTIINSSMAKKYWPNDDPLGKQVGPKSLKFPAATIVGIVADTKRLSLREQPSPEMYVLYTQKVWPSLLAMDVVLRANVDPASLTSSASEAIRSLDAGVPLAKVQTLTAVVDDSMTQQRFSVLLLGCFGALALLLASIGMYGVISYSVAQRTQEIGIRMVLGAQRRSVFQMVLGQGARLGGLGIMIGLVGALGVTRLLAGFLYGVRPTDPVTFAGVSLLLLAVALLACYIPARRAMRVDPMVAIRYE
jgi:putative ABC transport system permease protein